MIRVRGSNKHKTYSYELRQRLGPNEPGHFAWSVDGAFGLGGSPAAADIAEVGRAIQLADRAIRRSAGAANQYRSIEVTVPVRRREAWESQRDRLESIAEFATSDTWRFKFTTLRSGGSADDGDAREHGCGIVALFSGGLDSLCGVAHVAEESPDTVFVTHSPPGRTATRKLVRGVYAAFGREAPPADRFVSFHLTALQNDPATGESMFQEKTWRSRPVFFLSLAVAVAVAARIPKVQMSENGAMALSLPNRYDTHGPAIARQAHSFILEEFGLLVADVCDGESVPEIVNPFAAMTKGEVCEVLGSAAPLAARSVSCEYYGHQRARILAWIKEHPGPARRHRLGGGPQCGLCYPCLVRRAALHHAGIDDPSAHYFADARNVLAETKRRESALELFAGRTPPPLLNSLGQNPLYHERFCKSLQDMSPSDFAIRYLPQLRSVRPSKDVGIDVPTGARMLMRRFAKEQLGFLHASAP